MKIFTRNLFLLPAFLVGIALLLAGRATAQTFTTLHNFSATDPVTGLNSDGAYPTELLLSGDTLYGATARGGTSGDGTSGGGTLFMVNTNGTGFTTLHNFANGGNLEAGVILSGNTLYGTESQFTRSGFGTVFALNTDGTGFTTLYTFTGGSDGGYPDGRLIISGSTLYGTTDLGGGSGKGTVFKVNTDGTGFTVLHSFSVYPSDGANMRFGLVLLGSTLYGAAGGGIASAGVVFALNTNGTSFTILHNFTALDLLSGTNTDGAFPDGGLILSGNTLYGTALNGGKAGIGTVFSVQTDGTGFTVLHHFTGGGYPEGDLALLGGTLYGVANAAVFAVNTNGSGFTYLLNSTVGNTNASGIYTNSTGATFRGSLVLSGKILYGAAFGGGSGGSGTIFRTSASFVPITASLSSGVAPLTVNYSSSGVDNSGNAITNWNWNFGDGSISTAQNPSHTYNTPGSFPASLLATNNNGVLITEAPLFIMVTPPTLRFTASPTNGPIPLIVQFNSPAVDSGGSAIIRWNWAFGDGSTSTTQNPSHIYTDTSAGSFHPSLIATNSLRLSVLGSGPSITPPFNSGLVIGGGFETGTFAGWTLSGDTSYTIVDNGSQSGISPYSGSYLAALGTTSARGYLTQTLNTTAGASYLLSCRLDSPDGQAPNEFLVSWNGNTLFDQINIPAIGWTNLQFVVTATGIHTVLQFGFRDEVTYLGLDDIRVVPVIVSPPPLSIAREGVSVILTWPTNFTGFTLQATTNLASINLWSNVLPASVVVNGQNTVTNPISGTRKFYRLTQ